METTVQKLKVNTHPFSEAIFLKAGFVTSDQVVVGVVTRSEERYDLVKIKPTKSEAEH